MNLLTGINAYPFRIAGIFGSHFFDSHFFELESELESGLKNRRANKRASVSLTVCSLSLALLSHPVKSVACATCLCGDPTLTTMGTEKPYAGRLRISVDALDREERMGTRGVDDSKTEEKRLTYSLNYAPSTDWVVGISLPMITKQVDRFDLAQEQASGMGDPEITARWFAGRDREHFAQQLWGLQFGLRLPWANEQKFQGEPIDFDAQPATGATVPSVGAWYGLYRAPWLSYTSVSVQHAIDEGFQGYNAGDVVLLTETVQYALHPKFALQVSIDGRWKARDSFHGVDDADSGGTLAMLSPGAVWMPLTDVVIHLNYQTPVFEHLNGEQKEHAYLRAGIVYDF